jgi:hypothetical protein
MATFHNQHVKVTGSRAFKRNMMRALLKLPVRYRLIAKVIVERKRLLAVASADAETGTIRINPGRLAKNRNAYVLPSVLVHENTHLLQGPVNDRYIKRIEREAYAAQIKYLRKVGKRRLAQHFKDITESNIAEQTRVTYI